MSEDADVERLVVKARTMRFGLTKVEYDGIAALALAIAQDTARRKNAVLTPALARDYGAMSEDERAGLRQGVGQVLKALVLLEIIDFTGS